MTLSTGCGGRTISEYLEILIGVVKKINARLNGESRVLDQRELGDQFVQSGSVAN